MQHFCKVPSLRSLCCMAMQVFGLEKENLPIEVKETIKEIKAAQKPQLTKYIVLRKCHFGAFSEFLDTSKNILSLMANKDGDFLSLHSLLRKECYLFRSLVKFVPMESERELMASVRELLALSLIREYSFAKRRFLMEMVFWIGPEKAGNFWC
uniref:Uncharacterized protein n=1 Tax=Marseillevirus sp. TaxID=2809551 RepID=A0AA96ER72_9VIRU|nr:hypothetical protein MarFTMF_116 [Marseillevirus sp.]